MAERRDNEVSESALLQFADHLISSTWSRRDAEIRAIRDMVFLEDKPNLPEIEDMVVARTPLAYEAVRTQVGHLTANPPRVVVYPLGESDRDHEIAQRLEQWIAAVLERLANPEPFIEMALWSAVADGLGVLKASWTPWSDYPLRDDESESDKDYNERVASFLRRAPVPFVVQSVDPLTYYPVYGPTGLEAVVEHGFRPRVWAARNFDINFTRSGKVVIGGTRPQATYLADAVEYHEIWTPTSVYYMVQRKLVKTIHHGYLMIPYFEVSGETTSVREANKYRKSYVWPFVFLSPLYDTLLNVAGHHVLREAHPSFYETRDPNVPGSSLDANQQPIDIPLGAIVPGRPGSQLSPMNPPPLSRAVIEMMSLLASLMDRTGGNPILGGYSPGSRTPGITASVFMEAAKARLQGTARSMGIALKNLVVFLLWLVKNKVQQPVYLLSIPDGQRRRSSIYVNPSDCDRFSDLDVFIDLTLPQDDIAKHMDAINLANNRLRSRWSAIEMSGGDPDVEMRRMAVERLLDMPEVWQTVAQAALQKRGIGQQLAEGEAAMEILNRLARGQFPGALGQGGGGVGLPPEMMGGTGGGEMMGPPVPPGGTGVGVPGNIPSNSVGIRSPGAGGSPTPSGPGRPALRARRRPGRPVGG